MSCDSFSCLSDLMVDVCQAVGCTFESLVCDLISIVGKSLALSYGCYRLASVFMASEAEIFKSFLDGMVS